MSQLAAIFVVIAAALSPSLNAAESVSVLRAKVLDAARTLLDTTEVSYVYGGRALGSGPDCDTCNQCLAAKSPGPKERFANCPECTRCSLDCSHFTQLVYEKAGLKVPYLTTALMAELGPEALTRDYHMVAAGDAATAAQPGDLLVYNGHVVILESVGALGFGDVIHATSGLELKGPGMGIQRVRHAQLANFRGPLLRVLRHVKLAGPVPSAPKQSRIPHLRPIKP